MRAFDLRCSVSPLVMLADAPWALAPAQAIFMVVLGVNLVVQGKSSVNA